MVGVVGRVGGRRVGEVGREKAAREPEPGPRPSRTSALFDRVFSTCGVGWDGLGGEGQGNVGWVQVDCIHMLRWIRIGWGDTADKNAERERKVEKQGVRYKYIK